MMHHRWRQRIVTHQIGDDTVILHDVAVDDAGPGEKPMTEILLVETRRQVELVQILDKKPKKEKESRYQYLNKNSEMNNNSFTPP